jgi:ADP-ribosylation factor GTPase-activating protein 1
MENYSHPEIPEILKVEGNTTCIDCGSEKPNWASLNNGVFLCLKCAGVHRGFGMSVSLIRSLQIDSWTEKQLLYLKKGGNNNFKNNLSEFNIAETATLDIKYKSKAADYYRKYLKNEVEKESEPNYAPIQIDKPDMEVAMDLLEVKGDGEEAKIEPKPEENKKVFKNKFFGFMNNVLTKVKAGTTDAAKKVGKGFTDLKIKDKLKVAGNAIAGAAKTSSHFIAENSMKAVNKTKEGMNNLAQKTKTAFTKGNQHKNSNETTNQTEEKKEENKEEVKEGEKKEEEKKR